MPERTKNLPGKYSDEEIAKIVKDAAKAKLTPANYIRKLLKLPKVEMGPPEGNRNAAKYD